jgi:nucleotide-binding universal stress UspA family protein
MSDTSSSHSDPAEWPVVVGIDGSRAAIHAAEWAVEEAVSREVPLRLIYVIPEQSEPAPFAAVGNERMEVEYGETALRIASAAVTARGEAVKIESAILKGDSASQLVAESCYAAMVCVGSTGVGRLAKALFGSTATEVAETAHCPVAIVRSQQSRPSTENALIAVAVENSPDSNQVVGHAMAEAHMRDAPVLAVGAWRRDSGAMADPDLDTCIQAWRNRYPDVGVSATSARAEVADYLAVLDHPIQLVVIGAADIDQLTRLMERRHHHIGTHAERSVLIVRSPGEKADNRYS